MLNNLFYGLQHGRRKLSLIGNAGIAIFILFLLYTFTRTESARSFTKNIIQKLYGHDDLAPPDKYNLFTLETVDLSHLTKHQLSENFFYARRIVNTKYVASERRTLTDLQQSLFKQSARLSHSNLGSLPRRQDLPLTLDVSVPPSLVGANTLSFGIATPIHRLLDSLPQLMHWLPNTGAMLHVISPADPRVKNVTEHIRNLGINITILESNDRFPINYFSLLPLLYHTRLPGTKWLALIDDDTFFPDLGNLLSHLGERYNPKLPQVISGVSDDIVQIKKHGLMPFGGGGIFLSVPFAAMIVDNNYPGTAGATQGGKFPTPPNPNYSPFGPPMAETATGAPLSNYIIDHHSPYRHSTAFKGCLATEKYEGDQILSDCINKQTKVRPQYDIDFHQMDLKGDTSGFFESGRRSLTIHHWKTWFNVDIPSVASVTKICGKDCFLQRFRFKGLDAQHTLPDETWVLNNGYSITKYPNGIKGLSKDLPKPPPPPPSPNPDEVSDSSKDPITANPRFLRPTTGKWAEWPDLGLGEEVVYEGEMGTIVDKATAKGEVPNEKTDPYKGFGNLMWVPMNRPFAKETGATPPEGPPSDKLNKGGESVPTSPAGEMKKFEATSKEPPGQNATEASHTENDVPTTAAVTNDEISHFQRFRRTVLRKLWSRDLPPSDAQPVPNADDIPTDAIISAILPDSKAKLELDREQYEDDLEDERRFWEGIEKTWGGEADRFEHAIGPLRRELRRDEEVVRFLMVESVGGWGDPGKQDTEDVRGGLIPERLVKGFEGDPAMKKDEVRHGGKLMLGDEPAPKMTEGHLPAMEAGKRNPVAIGGGSVMSARSPKSQGNARSWFSSSSSPSETSDWPTEGGGIGGIDRVAVDWVRQTYVRRRPNPEDGDEKGEDEVIELIWVR